MVCKGFQFEIVQHVFTQICIEEILSEIKTPRYQNIINLLSVAIAEVEQVIEEKKVESSKSSKGVFASLRKKLTPKKLKRQIKEKY